MPRSKVDSYSQPRKVRNLKKEHSEGNVEVNWKPFGSASYKKKQTPRYLNAARRKVQKGF